MRRRLLWLLVAVLALPVLIPVAASLWLLTEAGQRQAAALVGRAASTPDIRVEIDGLAGLPPLRLEARGLRLADGDGVWLDLDRAEIAWSPLALLRREVRIDRVIADRLHLFRLPAGSDAAEPAAPALPSVPDLPVRLTLDRLAVAEIVLDAAVLGEPAVFALEAHAALGAPAEGLRAALALTRRDGADGRIAFDLEYRPADRWLAVDLDIAEPEGGLIARLADLPGLPPVELQGRASGPVEDWRLDLRGAAGPGLGLVADIALAAEAEGLRLTGDGRAELTALLPEEARPWIGDGIGWRLEMLLRAATRADLDRLALTARGGELTAQGSLAADALDLTVGVALAPVLPDLSWTTARLDGQASGSPARPSLSARVTVEELSAPGARVGRLALSATAVPTAPLTEAGAAVDLTADLTAAGLATGVPGLDALLGPESRADLAARIGLDGAVTLDRLAVALPALDLRAGGAATGWGDSADLRLDLAVPEMAALAPLSGLDLAGALEAGMDVAVRAGEIAGPLDLVWRDAATGIAAADGLLGDRVSLAADLAAAPAEGWVDLSAVRLHTAGLEMVADATWLGDALAAGWRLTLDDLARLGSDFAGTLTLAGSLSGPLESLSATVTADAPALTLAGRSVAALDVSADATGLPDRPRADWRATARLDGLPVEAGGALTPDGAGVRLSDLRLALRPLALTGEIALDGDGLATGRLTGGAPNLAGLRPLLGADLSGGLTMTVDLTAPQGRQDAALTVAGRGLGMDGMALARLDLTAAAADLRGSPRLDARLTAAEGTAGGIALDALTLTARGDPADLAIALEAEGRRGDQPLALDLAAAIAPEAGGARIGLRSLAAVVGPERVELAAPTVLRLSPGAYAVDRLDLRVRTGGVVLAGRLADTADLSLEIDALPLDLTTAFVGDLGLDGVLDGSARISGRHAAPTAEFSFRLRDGSAQEAAAFGVDRIAAGLDGTWRDGRLRAEGRIDIDPSGGVVLTADLPLRPGPLGALPSVPAGEAASFRAEGSLDLALVNDLLAGGADRVVGRVEVDLSASGPVDGLVAQGHLTLREGRYENLDFGTRLTDLEADLRGTARQLVVERLVAATPGGGRLEGSGSVLLDVPAGLPVDVRIAVTDGRLVDNDLAAVTVDADLAITGGALVDPLLAGRVTVSRADLRLPESLPRTVPTIEVTEINLPADARPQAEADSGASVLPRLDLAVAAPQAVYLRGRGLDVELGGDLTVTGSAAAPVLVGLLTLRRGTLDLFGRRFAFERGTIRFDGGAEIDPLIDLEARLAAREVTGIVRVAGRASDLSITFSSEPELPEDEVLARVLFNKRMGELTAIESVFLAQSLAASAGFGVGSVVEDFRRGLGLDRLTVEADEAGTGAQFEAGQYIADGVFLGVRQGAGADSSALVLEIELTPNVTVESDVGGARGGRVGIRMEWDY